MDFWNNPIVVSAMRLKYRKSSPGILAALWAMGLLAIGVVLHYVALREPFPVAKTFLLIIFCVHFVLCGVIAMFSTSSSMNAEVVNRTLDFQRIVSLSPQAILVGKMIGEPTITYFLAMASVPFAVLCWAAGGGSFGEILFLYINLASFILMAASLGLIHSLTPPTPGANRQRSGGGAAFIVLFVVLPQLLIHTGRAINAPVVGEFLQLLTPIGSLMSFWQGSAWLAHVTLWGFELPSLVVGPVMQLAIAAWVVAAMARRLKNPIDPAVPKRRAYLTVLVLDALLAGICFSKWRDGASPGALAFGFCFGHLVFCLLLVFAIVPRQTAVMSWIWRRRPNASRLRDLALADRSEISLAALILGLIGPAALVVAFIVPMNLLGGKDGANAAIAPATFVEPCAVTVVLVVAAAIMHQLFAAVAKRGGHLLYMLVLLVLNVLPPITAAMLDSPMARVPRETQEFVASLSPAAYYFMNMSQWAPNTSGKWLAAIYLALAALCYRLLQRWIRRQTTIVDQKLSTMALGPAAPSPA
jgi:hypothetical protein